MAQVRILAHGSSVNLGLSANLGSWLKYKSWLKYESWLKCKSWLKYECFVGPNGFYEQDNFLFVFQKSIAAIADFDVGVFEHLDD